MTFQSPALQLDLSGYGFKVAPAQGQTCVLGVRPESIAQATGTSGHDATMTVDLVEPMGALKIAWLRAGESRMAIQLDAASSLQIGDTLKLLINRKSVSMFDAASQQRL